MRSKEKIRQEVKQKIAAIPQEVKQHLSTLISERVASCELFSLAQIVLLYHPLPDEPDIWIHPSIFKEKTILLPSIQGDEIRIRPYQGVGCLTKGAFGILEPQTALFEEWDKIDLCLIPGRGFDLSGHRLGRGKGYYDKILSMIAAPKIGIGFECQLYCQIPVESHDIPLQGIITEERFHHIPTESQ